MKIISSGIKDGYIEEKYGKYGDQNLKGMPSKSLPLQWETIPEGTKSYALVMEDFDAIPVTGFSWIHWVTIIPKEYLELKENASLDDKNLIQGVNSWISSMGGLDQGDASHFGGPAPPDKTHTYTIKLYALDVELSLKSGFYLNELYKSIDGHILDMAKLEGKYNN
ncbi:YbhB/YbcL family Raf kinase inhibitor-like protein [uncultured Cetobacterium sp.]|uniref:YbhB/YbcL family Raf kinase inhibitor-like protein n=1 Tax=uncultured Cetobacterium sp. TaxID=527638 RepID=UPI0026170CBE|nr:YbhB/YbcL family Raf kinase inhibitor-like protein [uncultured Cetobacterium sp.]